jgi:Flp pilus assembly protein TadG
MARNLIRTQKGITMVELAIILPILFIIIFGIAELAIALYDKAVLTNASREGARYGIVARAATTYPTPRIPNADIRQVVADYARNYLITFGADSLQPDDTHIPITWTDITNDGMLNFGDELKVSVNYRYDFLVLSRLISALGVDVTLNATTVMKLE